MKRQRRPYISTLVLTGSLVMTGCAGLSKGHVAFDAGGKERGIASWYGDDFHGWVTASGEPYDMYAMTGAHRTLPLGTMIRVVNVVNGRHVVIRINDRGPYVNGRILDLSYAAAERLQMVKDGISAVQIEVIGHHSAHRWIAAPKTTWTHFAELSPDEGHAARPWRATLPLTRTRTRDARAIPSDLLMERRPRRVPSILAIASRAETVAILT